MPKDITCRFTTNYYQRIAAILISSLKIVVSYYYYKKESLKCVIKLITSYYAYYIYVKARCSLVFFNIKRKEFNNKQRATKLRITRAKAKLAATKLSLLKSKAKRRRQKLEEITITKELK